MKKKKKPEKEKIIITCAAFDPLTSDDLKYLNRCKAKGDWLIVGVQSDARLAETRGGFMQPYSERREIACSLKMIDEIFNFNDMDGTVSQLLRLVKFCYPNATIIYVSEEDMQNMPESKITGITFETMKEE